MSEFFFVHSFFNFGILEPENSDESKIIRLRDTFTELGAEKVAHWQTIKYLCQHFYRYEYFDYVFYLILSLKIAIKRLENNQF